MSKKKIRICQTGSRRGTTEGQQECLRGLGLRRIGHTVEREDTPAIRGLVNKIPHLARIDGEAK
ncbi:MAG: 50S ribosomal protein L30 [Bdellovibrionota bacterium]